MGHIKYNLIEGEYDTLTYTSSRISSIYDLGPSLLKPKIENLLRISRIRNKITAPNDGRYSFHLGALWFPR